MQGNAAKARRARTAAVLFVSLVVVGVLAGPAPAQRQGPAFPNPRLLVITPSGGRAGTTFEMSVTGLDLEEPEGLLFSQPGIKAEPALASSTPPPKPDPKKKPAPPQRMAPVASRFKVTIPANTPLGIHDVRLINRWGISNPRAFVVGDLAEVLEKEPNNDVEQAQRVELNSTVNGTISAPTDVDYYVFAGQKGQRVLMSCLASSIDSRLPAALQVYDPSGKLLGSNRDYRGNDALLDCTLPSDGDYRVRVYSFTYTQGSPEHFYRLSITTAPWIDAIYPPMVEPGKSTRVTIYGRNLPGGQPDPTAVVDDRVLEKISVTIDAPGGPAVGQRLAYSGHVDPKSSSLDGFEYRVRNESGSSNPYLITLAHAPVVLDNGANDDAEHAQEVALPCEIAGRIEKRRDHDWYTFAAKKGEVYSIEAYADRIGSPMNLYFAIRRSDRKQTVADSSDSNEILSPVQFFSRTDDPQRYRFVAPADGAYYLMVSSREATIQASPRDLYRIRITPEQPDFRLVVMPPAVSSPEGCTLNKGGHQFYTVFVWRLDGFNGDVTVTAEDLPPGVDCPPQTISGTLKQGVLVLSAAADAEPWSGRIKVRGTATIEGREVVREARPATITWPVPQQNVATISRLDRDLVLAVRDEAPFTLTAKLDKDGAAVLPGQRLTVPLKLKRSAPDFKMQVLVTAFNVPPSLRVNGNNQPFAIAAGKDEGSAVFTVQPNAQPGTYTVVFRAQAQVPFSKDKKSKQRQNLVVTLPSNPVTITVLPKEVAKVTVAPTNPKVKVGDEIELLVKVQRLNDYRGDFNVELVLPKEAKGISAEQVTIPKGKDEARLVVKADAEAAPGNRTGLIVRATTRVNGKVPITQEAKVNLNVVK